MAPRVEASAVKTRLTRSAIFLNETPDSRDSSQVQFKTRRLDFIEAGLAGKVDEENTALRAMVKIALDPQKGVPLVFQDYRELCFAIWPRIPGRNLPDAKEMMEKVVAKMEELIKDPVPTNDPHLDTMYAIDLEQNQRDIKFFKKELKKCAEITACETLNEFTSASNNIDRSELREENMKRFLNELRQHQDKLKGLLKQYGVRCNFTQEQYQIIDLNYGLSGAMPMLVKEIAFKFGKRPASVSDEKRSFWNKLVNCAPCENLRKTLNKMIQSPYVSKERENFTTS